jgi:hypothetical protein
MEKLTEVKATITLELDVSFVTTTDIAELSDFDIEDNLRYFVNYGLFRDTERMIDFDVTSVEEIDNPNL